MVVKGKQINIPFALQNQMFDKLQNYIGNKKTLLLVTESVLWIKMDADTECTIKQCAICLEYHKMQPHEGPLNYEIPCRP